MNKNTFKNTFKISTNSYGFFLKTIQSQKEHCFFCTNPYLFLYVLKNTKNTINTNIYIYLLYTTYEYTTLTQLPLFYLFFWGVCIKGVVYVQKNKKIEVETCKKQPGKQSKE